MQLSAYTDLLQAIQIKIQESFVLQVPRTVVEC